MAAVRKEDSRQLEFEATVQHSKNRVIAIPAALRRRLGIRAGADRRAVEYALRNARGGRWCHHLGYVSRKGEISVPTDVRAVQPGRRLRVRIVRVFDLVEVKEEHENGFALLLKFAGTISTGRTDGSRRVDDYLYSREAICGESS